MIKKITMYELIELIKDNKAPKEIKIDDEIWYFIKRDNKIYYIDKKEYNFHCCQLDFNYYIENNKLNDTVEILPEEDEEWEDIPIFKVSDYKETFNQFQLDIVKQINLIKKNQKYLKEKLESKDE